MVRQSSTNTLLPLLLSLLVLTDLVVSEWQVFNADVEDKDDNNIRYMPSASPKSKGSKKSRDQLTLAQQTYQTTPATDPWVQFQNLAFSTNQLEENKDVIGRVPKNPNHSFKSRSNKNDVTPEKKSPDAPNKSKTKSVHVHSQNDEKSLEKKNKDLKFGPEPKPVEESKFATSEFRHRGLLEDEDYDKDLSLDNVEELNGDLDGDMMEEKEFRALLVEEERNLKNRKSQGWSGEIDCDDLLSMDEFDCLQLQKMADEANMSEAGERARRQLMDFMDLNSRQRRAVGDEGSGTGPTYPEDEIINNGRYSLKRSISFNVTVGNSTDEITEHLRTQLEKIFGPIKGFVNVVVNNVVKTDGQVTADWSLTVRGSGIGAYGGNEVDIANSLQFQLLNLSKPLYDQIDLGGANPEDPLDTKNIADTLAGNLNDICGSESPCSSEFDSCTVIGYDEGKCLHKCTILEQTRDCEHGGQCVIDGNNDAVCQCTTNWEGEYCESRRSLDPGEISGATVGAALAVAGLIGSCCWLALCRRRRKPVNMTYFGDDSDSSDKFSNPSSKISTFVIDRPRIKTNPIRSFSPHSHDDFSRPSSLSSLPPLMRPREPPNLFSDA